MNEIQTFEDSIPVKEIVIQILTINKIAKKVLSPSHEDDPLSSLVCPNQDDPLKIENFYP